MNTVEQAEARFAQARWQFYKHHPNVAPIQANEIFIDQWAVDNMKSLENVATWNAAYEALKDKLSENIHHVVVERPQAAPTAPAEPALEGQALLRKLIADLNSDNAETRFDAEDQLKRIQAGARLEKDTDVTYLARLYAPANLRRLPDAQLVWLRKKYGPSTVGTAINLTQTTRF
jgi:hypothetical protein